MEMMKKRFGKKSYANDRRKLNRKLKKAGIAFEWHYLYDGYQWSFANYPDGDIAIHSGTYGNRQGHFESYCMPWDDGDVTELIWGEIIQRMTEGK